MEAMMSERDERDERQADRERQIPEGLRAMAHHSAPLHAAATSYIVTGDPSVWERCFDALRADCERLDAELARHGVPAMVYLVGAWPDGALTTVPPITGAQVLALCRGAEVHRMLIDVACYYAALDAPTPIAVHVD